VSPASAQVLATRAPGFESWSSAPLSVNLTEPTDYEPSQWKLGAAIGAGVGIVLGTIILTTCDSDSNSDCPGWGRAAITLGTSTGIGALIGAFIHKRDPDH